MFRNILTILKREIRGYLYTPIAYVFIGGFSTLMGVMFWLFLNAYVRYTQESRFGTAPTITIDRLSEGFYSNMHMILLFILPFFTMRLFSEESRQNTLVLLMTSPVRVWELVLGKFFAAATVLLVMLVMTFICPMFLMLYATAGSGPDTGVIAATYLGLLLAGLVYIAVGIFWSSVTESQLVAVMMTFVTNFAFWLVGLGGEGVGTLASVMKHLSINEHFMTLLKGSLELQTMAYFISMIFFWLYLSNRSIESRAWRS